MRRDEFLVQAKKCICGDRDMTYGGPESNFERIAKLWSAYMDIEFTAEDVGMLMVLFKCARIKSGHGYEDSYTDCIGYCACAGEIATTKGTEDGRK